MRQEIINFLDDLSDVPYIFFLIFFEIVWYGLLLDMLWHTDHGWNTIVIMLFAGIIIPILETRLIQNLLEGRK